MASLQSLCLSSSEFPAQVQTSLKDVYRCELLSYWPTLTIRLSDWLKTLTTDRSELFTDLTLVTEDLRESRAHRLVVSSGSKVLHKILASKTRERDPVIFLSGILHEDLTFILQFLYYGDVTVPQVRISVLLTDS